MTIDLNSLETDQWSLWGPFGNNRLSLEYADFTSDTVAVEQWVELSLLVLFMLLHCIYCRRVQYLLGEWQLFEGESNVREKPVGELDGRLHAILCLKREFASKEKLSKEQSHFAWPWCTVLILCTLFTASLPMVRTCNTNLFEKSCYNVKQPVYMNKYSTKFWKILQRTLPNMAPIARQQLQNALR